MRTDEVANGGRVMQPAHVTFLLYFDKTACI
jgi:hypothetical protein